MFVYELSSGTFKNHRRSYLFFFCFALFTSYRAPMVFESLLVFYWKNLFFCVHELTNNCLCVLTISLSGYSGKQHLRKHKTRPRTFARRRIVAKLAEGIHTPTEGPTKRRCQLCSKYKKQSRTKYVCTTCNVALCLRCFDGYHTLQWNYLCE